MPVPICPRKDSEQGLILQGIKCQSAPSSHVRKIKSRFGILVNLPSQYIYIHAYIYIYIHIYIQIWNISIMNYIQFLSDSPKLTISLYIYIYIYICTYIYIYIYTHTHTYIYTNMKYINYELYSILKWNEKLRKLMAFDYC